MAEVKVGSRVRVTEIEECDNGYISVGDTGTVESELQINDGDTSDVFFVKFDSKDESELSESAEYCNGTYQMYRFQLEVIE